MGNGYIFVVVPTFRETDEVVALLDCLLKVKEENVKILIVNGNPGDETSRHIAGLHDKRVLELAGNPSLFWSGLVNIGLRHILQTETRQEFVIIMNADVAFEGDVITHMVNKARSTPHAQLAAVTVGDGQVISSGVKVVSWLLTINRHPLAGTVPVDIPDDTLIPVDFLPTRCTLIPFEAVRKAGLIAEAQLPHYGGDNEYTNRLRKLGYPAFIFTGSRVRVDTNNTGTDVFHKTVPLWTRVQSMFSIKSTANPVYRLRFVRMAYPWYTWPSAMLLYVVRSALEVLCGGGTIRNIVRREEAGFSGS